MQNLVLSDANGDIFYSGEIPDLFLSRVYDSGTWVVRTIESTGQLVGDFIGDNLDSRLELAFPILLASHLNDEDKIDAIMALVDLVGNSISRSEVEQFLKDYYEISKDTTSPVVPSTS